MLWFRREPEPPPSCSEDDPAVLLTGLAELESYLKLNSGAIPGKSVVTARRVIDALREIIETSETHLLDVHTWVSVTGISNDYLPTTLKTFLPAERGGSRGTGGQRPSDLLQEQLDALLDAAYSVLDASRTQDTDAMLTQGNFLRTKFSGSDLDL